MKKPNDTPADDSLEVLFPDRRLTVGGENLVVRELTFEEQLTHHAALKAIAEAFLQVPREHLEGVEGATIALDVLTEHWKLVLPLIAVSCGKADNWVRSLRPSDGESLMLVWWAANQGFFVRRLWRPIVVAQALQQGCFGYGRRVLQAGRRTGQSLAATQREISLPDRLGLRADSRPRSARRFAGCRPTGHGRL